MLEKLSKAEAITHYALTEDDQLDWNDISQTMNKKEFAKWFIGKVKKI